MAPPAHEMTDLIIFAKPEAHDAARNAVEFS